MGCGKGVITFVASKLRLGLSCQFLLNFFLNVYEPFNFGDISFVFISLSVF